MRIGEVARRSGVSVRALRYYEEQGLLTPTRSAGGQRQYPDGTVDRVRFFQQLYAAGLPSRRIAELLPCIDTGTTTGEQRAMLDAERARIRQQIDEYTAALARLDEIVAAAAERRA
ncbi:MerR family transcriptional regulator [Streptomyces sp. CMB-StM0423]|uniref:MerR family transcriptional regulator n=1 Tax=Streptomyces sp. CMB-StM0423 TaxID=2059884 RepID=UPI000C714AB6|nr:MerR family transcriptional regulator [Streptomyces sp. CMB-StM0423]AUH45026.1 MerR family transcriptional regulator [Streptomyces sp. CMB-StM0423]